MYDCYCDFAAVAIAIADSTVIASAIANVNAIVIVIAVVCIVVVGSSVLLKEYFLLGGLNHAPAIWLQKYSDLLRLLSSRLGTTSTVRRRFFC